MTDEQLSIEIAKEKNKRNTLVLSHTYQEPEIIDASDITGDSFFLSKKARESGAKRIVLCGVRFMAETVKLLSPDAEVILPVPSATCPMAEQIAPERVALFRKENPDTAIVCYINTTAALKAECDVCVTSSSAVKIVSKLPQKDILFIPDKNLGSYVAAKLPRKNIILWNGYCPVHGYITAKEVREAKEKYPDAVVAVHPECPGEVVALADMIGATSEIIRYAKEQKGRVIIATEETVARYLNLKENTDRFIALVPHKFICEDMKKTSLSDVYRAVKGECGEKIELNDEIREKARRCVDRMLELGQ